MSPCFILELSGPIALPHLLKSPCPEDVCLKVRATGVLLGMRNHSYTQTSFSIVCVRSYGLNKGDFIVFTLSSLDIIDMLPLVERRGTTDSLK